MIAKLNEIGESPADFTIQLTIPNLNSKCSSETNLTDLKDTPLENSIQSNDWTSQKKGTTKLRKSITPEPVKNKCFENVFRKLLVNA